MMPRHAARLLQRLLLTLLALALVAWLIWLQSAPSLTPHLPLPQQYGEAAYHVEEPRFRRFDQQGRLQQTLQGIRATHYPDNQITLIEQPRLHYLSTEQQDWLLDALQAELDHTSNTLLMQQDVHLYPADNQPATAASLQTERLWIELDRQQAHTSEPVLLLGTGLRTEATGLFADFQQNRLELLQDVSSQYQPAAQEHH